MTCTLDSGAAIRFEPGEPAEAILKVQHEENIDLLVAGAMETESVHRNFTGDVARELLRRAPCDLLLYTEPKENPKPPEGILVVVPDLSERSRQVLCAALNLAERSGGRQITILHVQTTFAEAKEKALGVSNGNLSAEETLESWVRGPDAAGLGTGLSSSARKHRIYGLRIHPVQRHRPGGNAVANAFFGSTRIRSCPRLDYSSHSRQPLGHPADGNIAELLLLLNRPRRRSLALRHRDSHTIENDYHDENEND